MNQQPPGWMPPPPAQPQAPPPPAPVYPKHYCFSGSPTCSGCVPCPACLIQVRTYVLPVAMGAAGFAGDPRQAQAFFDAYTRAGWPRLHQAMNQDPALANRFAAVDIVPMLQELAALRAEAVDRAARAAPPPQGEATGWVAPPSGPAGERTSTVLVDPQAPTLNAASPPVVPAAGLPSGTWIREMDADDVVAAMKPVQTPVLTAPPTPPSNAVVLGNVMTVPPGMEHHLSNGERQVPSGPVPGSPPEGGS